jgi:hypothetical protein
LISQSKFCFFIFLNTLNISRELSELLLDRLGDEQLALRAKAASMFAYLGRTIFILLFKHE